MSERAFTAQRVIARTPWDVFDFIADGSQQSMWRDRHNMAGQYVEESEPYTRILYSDRLEFTFEPSGEDTLVTLTRTREGKGAMGAVSLRMFSRRAGEEEMGALLARIESAMLYEM